MQYFILDEAKNPVPCDSDKWGPWMDPSNSTNWRTAKTDLGKLWVSTVFLGLDHGLSGDGAPLLWETMVFEHGSWSELYYDRYTTHADALAGHEKAVELVRAGKVVAP